QQTDLRRHHSEFIRLSRNRRQRLREIVLSTGQQIEHLPEAAQRTEGERGEEQGDDYRADYGENSHRGILHQRRIDVVADECRRHDDSYVKEYLAARAQPLLDLVELRAEKHAQFGQPPHLLHHWLEVRILLERQSQTLGIRVDQDLVPAVA